MPELLPHLYFAYGSNIPTTRLRSRCPDALAVGPAWLTGWRLAFARHATIRPWANARVPGVVWRLSDAGLRALDRFEGYPHHYRRNELTVQTPDGDELRALVYVMNNDPDQPPEDWYLEIIREGYEEWGLPFQSLTEAVSRSRHRLHQGQQVPSR